MMHRNMGRWLENPAPGGFTAAVIDRPAARPKRPP